MRHNYSYQSTLATSERIGWKVEDLIGRDKQLDFKNPFMPESLAQLKQLSFLTPEEQTTLNQIRGHEYLAMFVPGGRIHSDTGMTHPNFWKPYKASSWRPDNKSSRWRQCFADGLT